MKRPAAVVLVAAWLLLLVSPARAEDRDVTQETKTIPDAVAELREAVDFCRYYAAHGMRDFNENGHNLRSYTGESNKILLQGRGPFVCISPWNFPLAIFTGQIVAALMAGGCIAMPTIRHKTTKIHLKDDPILRVVL